MDLISENEMLITIKELPKYENIEENNIYEISTNNVSYFSHSFFKYPAKFIPQIPKWAIDNFTEPGDIVLDCFAGSGTTLVEACLNNRESVGVDFDEISKLLSKVKTSNLTEEEKVSVRFIMSNLNLKKFSRRKLPNLSNLKHWFSESNIKVLNSLYYLITETIDNQKVKDFLLVCFISAIRKSSYSDEQSPKPYISSKHPKEPQNALTLFISIVDSYLEKLESDKFHLFSQAKFIGSDARNFKSAEYFNKIKLVCASPPYINAFDYVRILRLENVWLRNLDDNNLKDHKKKQIGTEQIYAEEYNKLPLKIGLNELDNKIEELFNVDKKRAHIVYKYFVDMEMNISNVRNYLSEEGKYVLVVGDCEIRKIIFPVYSYLIQLAMRNKYSKSFVFSYLIKNPYLRIPRNNRGGLIKFDRIIVLHK